MRIGIILPPVGSNGEQEPELVEAARYAEQADLDSVWHGDHLTSGPCLECTVALSAAAAVTSSIGIGASVFVPGIRPLAWAAKQIASLARIANGRLMLGIGSGAGAGQWAAAGRSFPDRGVRTDAALRALPDLLSGKSVRLTQEPGEPEVQLAPAVEVPPLWVGNASEVAIRRAARLGDGWFPSLVPPATLAEGAARLAELAATYDRPTPAVVVGAVGALGDEPGLPTRDELAAEISGAYGGPSDRLRSVPITGGVSEVADQLRAHRSAGADHLVLGLAGGDWRRQVDLLAEVRAVLADDERHS